MLTPWLLLSKIRLLKEMSDYDSLKPTAPTQNTLSSNSHIRITQETSHDTSLRRMSAANQLTSQLTKEVNKIFTRLRIESIMPPTSENHPTLIQGKVTLRDPSYPQTQNIITIKYSQIIIEMSNTALVNENKRESQKW